MCVHKLPRVTFGQAAPKFNFRHCFAIFTDQFHSLWPICAAILPVGTTMMSMLPAIPVLLLGFVIVWLLWPVVVDPLARRFRAHRCNDDRDQLAEGLFDRWSQG